MRLWRFLITFFIKYYSHFSKKTPQNILPDSNRPEIPLVGPKMRSKIAKKYEILPF